MIVSLKSRKRAKVSPAHAIKARRDDEGQLKRGARSDLGYTDRKWHVNEIEELKKHVTTAYGIVLEGLRPQISDGPIDGLYCKRGEDAFCEVLRMDPTMFRKHWRSIGYEHTTRGRDACQKQWTRMRDAFLKKESGLGGGKWTPDELQALSRVFTREDLDCPNIEADAKQYAANRLEKFKELKILLPARNGDQIRMQFKRLDTEDLYSTVKRSQAMDREIIQLHSRYGPCGAGYAKAPYFVEDKKGKLVKRHLPSDSEVIRKRIHYLQEEKLL